MHLGDYIAEVAGVAAVEAVRRVQLGELSDMGQAEAFIASAIKGFFEKHGPTLATQVAAYLEPATKKAVEVIKPSVEQALRDYTPTFAAITGGMLALSVLLGVWIARRRR